MTATETAFARYRAKYRPRDPADVPSTPDQFLPMAADDGLTALTDGPFVGIAERVAPSQVPDPMLYLHNQKLWIIRHDDVVYANERCAFARNLDLPDGKIKHTNLTGGLAAYAGGEILKIENDALILNSCSGRYRLAATTSTEEY